MEKTLFQKIIDREIPADIVHETESIITIKDIRPQAPVHYLVITKIPYPSFEELPTALFGEVQAAILQVVDETNIRNSGYRVVTNIRSDGGQSAPHLHFHVLGGHRLNTRLG